MTLRSVWFEVRGARMHALTSATPELDKRPPLLLVHGAAVSSEHMRPAAEALTPHFPVYVPDCPVTGSDDAASVLDAGGHAERLAEWMRAAGVGRAHVCPVVRGVAGRPNLHRGREEVSCPPSASRAICS